MPTPSLQAQAALDECIRQGAAIAATQDAPCGVYSSSILKSLGLTFQGLVMAFSLALAAVTIAANSGASKSRFLVKMRSRMNVPFFLGATIAYGSFIFIYQGPHTVTVILAYWMRELGFSIHYGAVFLKILSELRHQPLLRLERLSAASAGATNGHALDSGENAAASYERHVSTASASTFSPLNNKQTNRNSKAAHMSITSSLLPPPSAAQGATHRQTWLRASTKLNQTRLNKSSTISFIYLLLVPVVALSVWSAAFASLPLASVRHSLCFSQPWSYVFEGFELFFIAFSFALCVRIIHKGGRSQRLGPLFEVKLFKLLAVLLVNEFMFSTALYAVRHAVAIKASSDMIALFHMLRDNLTITLNLMAIFIFKVAIRGGQMGSRTNVSSKSVTANKVASSAASAVSNNNSVNGGRPLSVLSNQQPPAIRPTNKEEHQENANSTFLAVSSRQSGDEVDDEASEVAQSIEIAELKRELRRVQMQAEYYRVKAMRKDNPHLNNSGATSLLVADNTAEKKQASTESSPSKRPATEKVAVVARPASGNNNSNSNGNNPSVLNRVPPAPPLTQNTDRLQALKSSLKLPSSGHSSTSSSHR